MHFKNMVFIKRVSSYAIKESVFFFNLRLKKVIQKCQVRLPDPLIPYGIDLSLDSRSKIFFRKSQII